MIGRRDGSYVRSRRLITIARMIAAEFAETKNNGANSQCNIEDLITQIEFEIGLTEGRARSYVDTVVKAKGWVVKDGFIYPE